MDFNRIGTHLNNEIKSPIVHQQILPVLLLLEVNLGYHDQITIVGYFLSFKSGDLK